MAGKAPVLDQDCIMKPAAMRLMLPRSADKPLSCAIGVTGTDDVILSMEMPKMGKPKKVLAQLIAEAGKLKKQFKKDIEDDAEEQKKVEKKKKTFKDADLKKIDAETKTSIAKMEKSCELSVATSRFGTAQIAPTDDKLVQLRVNKPVKQSFELALRGIVKSAGYRDVEFVVDEELDNDSEEMETEGEIASPPPAPPPPPPPRDARALTGELARLIGQIKALANVDPAYVTRLNGLVAATGANLKAAPPALAQAETNLTTLADLLAHPVPLAPSGSGSGSGSGAAPSPEQCAKSRDVWLLTRKRVDDSISALRKAILETYKDGTIGADLEKAFTQRVGPVMETLDERLGEKLDEAAKTPDAGARGTLMADAKALMKEYLDYVGSAEIVVDLDANPFTPIKIQETVVKTLTPLSQVH